MKVNLMNGFDQDDQPVCFIEIYTLVVVKTNYSI
jgi:hypothetical protein